MHTSLQKYKQLDFQKKKKKSLVQLISVVRTEHGSSSVLIWKSLFFFLLFFRKVTFTVNIGAKNHDVLMKRANIQTS